MTNVLWFFPLLLLFSYVLSSVVSTKQPTTKTSFLVANRDIGSIPAAFSIAAAWIWAPSLFVSAQKAYTDGWVGLLYFTVPNILCLILFAVFATKIRERLPQGFTLSELMAVRYSKRMQSLYWVTLIGLTTCAYAVQLLAGGWLLHALTGTPYELGVAILALLPLSYSLVFGLRSSIFTDFAKVIIIFLGFCVLGPMLIDGVGVPAIAKGMSGIKNDVSSLFDARGTSIFLSFGLPVTIGLLSGPFGDQAFWQRAFSIKEVSKVKSVFIASAFIFAVVPLFMGVVGFAAAGVSFIPKNPEMVNIEFIAATLPSYAVLAFVFIVFSGIVSILDSKLCAVSSIFAHDILDRFPARFHSEAIWLARFGMVAVTLVAMLIALIPELKIVHLFLFYGTLRAATLIPTMVTLVAKVIPSEPYVFYGIISALILGLPAFAFGTLTKNMEVALCASILTVLLPGVFIAVSYARRG